MFPKLIILLPSKCWRPSDIKTQDRYFSTETRPNGTRKVHLVHVYHVHVHHVHVHHARVHHVHVHVQIPRWSIDIYNTDVNIFSWIVLIEISQTRGRFPALRRKCWGWCQTMQLFQTTLQLCSQVCNFYHFSSKWPWKVFFRLKHGCWGSAWQIDDDDKCQALQPRISVQDRGPAKTFTHQGAPGHHQHHHQHHHHQHHEHH